MPGHRELLDPSVHPGRGDAHEFVDRRSDVGDEGELIAPGSGRIAGDPFGPVHHHRHVDPAFVGVLLVPLERGVAALRPAPRVVGVAVRAADVVDALDGLVGRLEDPVEELHLVHDPERTALLRCAVVRQHDEHGVVELSEPSQSVDEATDLIVGVVEERGEGLLESTRQSLLVLREVVPGVDTRIAWCEFGPLRNDAELELALEPALAHDVPALVELPAVLCEVLRWRLMRCMRRSEREVGEERPIGAHADTVGDHPQCLVDQILRQVIAIVGARRRRDGVVVGDQFGVELVGLALHEAVEPVEPTRQRPLVERAGGRTLLHRREVPLADRERGVAGIAKHLGHRCGVVRDVAEHVRKPRAEVRHGPHPDGVLRSAGRAAMPGSASTAASRGSW